MPGKRTRSEGVNKHRITLHYGKLDHGSFSDSTVAPVRQEFLDKLTVANPQIVASLGALLPQYRETKLTLVREQPPGHSVAGRLGWFAVAFFDTVSAEGLALKAAILAWARKHHLEREWILDAALNTLDFWSRRATIPGQQGSLATDPRQLIMPAADVRNRGEFETPFVYRAQFCYEEGEPISAYRKRLMNDIQQAVN